MIGVDVLRAVLFTLGLGLTVAGTSIWFGPGPALVLAGVEMSALMWLLEKAKAAAPPRRRRIEEDFR